MDTYEREEHIEFLTRAEEYAQARSGCTKVSVGCFIVQHAKNFKPPMIIGTGHNGPLESDVCEINGCLRMIKYGNSDKTHRNPDDCRAVHAEIMAIADNAKRHNYGTNGATAYVTRYPCEACARALVLAGIKEVIYAREQEISDMSRAIFEIGGVKVIHIPNLGFYDATN